MNSGFPLPISGDGYAVVDLETNGLKTSDSIIEIGIVLLDENGVFERGFSSLIRPEHPVRNTEIHHITDDMVRHAPTLDILGPQIISILDGRKLVAHNASFETRLFNRNFADYDVLFALNNFIDTLLLARKFCHTPNHKLMVIAESFGLNIDGIHQAYSDALITAQILKQFIDNPVVPGSKLQCIPFYGGRDVVPVDENLWFPRS